MGAKRRVDRHTVAVLVYDGISPFELAVACEVFGLDRSAIADPWYRFVLCGERPGRLRAQTGFWIETDHTLNDLARADTVIVPAWRQGEPEPNEAILVALRKAHRRGARMVSFCTGAYALAAAGILDGRRATTHWKYADQLAERFPNVAVDPKVLYVVDGNVYTSAGTAAAIDLSLSIVRNDYGADVANTVARYMVIPPHRDGGQAQYVDAPVPCCPDDDPLAGVLAWATEHLDQPLSVTVLAARAAMSPRNFARRFRAVTGTTPHQWVLTQRVILAQRLLETTEESVERIADQCGLGTAANLRQHFQRQVGTSPLAYRRTFRQERATA